MYPFTPSMIILLALIPSACILVIGPVVFAVIAWKRSYWSITGRVHYTLVTLGLLGMVWLMNFWNLSGFRY